jgi:hypothetical protein
MSIHSSVCFMVLNLSGNDHGVEYILETNVSQKTSGFSHKLQDFGVMLSQIYSAG